MFSFNNVEKAYYVCSHQRLGGESFVTPPTGKSRFVFVFALRACVRAVARARRDARSDVVSRHVFVPSPSPPPAAGSLLQNCSEINC